MNNERSEKIKELVNAALELPLDARAAFLDQACAGDEELRGEVESLLAFDDGAKDALDTAAPRMLARAFAAEQRRDWVGQSLGHYRIVARLGAGGMGEVYRAEDGRLGRTVAIKLLPAEFTADPQRVRRFEQEARAASSLNHPNIITVHEIGRQEEVHYIACELVEGVTLRQRLGEGPFIWQEAANIGAQIAAALKAAHSAGIIHRDIKPENVMLRADGLVKVLDFGIAKSSVRFVVPPSGGSRIGLRPIPPEGGTTNFTAAGMVLGTVNYMSPEQARGDDEIDARTDIFSLGVMLYEMLAEHPFAEKPAAERLEEVASDEELPPIGARCRDIPAQLAAIVTRATRKRREQRYESAAEMLEALDELRPPIEAKAAEKERKLLARESANRLLNQFVALYARDQTTRLSPAALWGIWRHSDIERGRLETGLLRSSLFSALGKAGAIALAAALVALILAALFSVDEEWKEQVLHDGHTRRALQVALSPDGQTLVSVGNDKRIIVWDLPRRVRRATLTAHTEKVTATTFSPDGKWLATLSSDNQLTIWDAARLTKTVVLPGTRGWASRVAFTPDGRLLIAPGDVGKPCNVWEVGTWRKVSTVACGNSLLLSPDSRLVLDSDWYAVDRLTGKEFPRDPDHGYGDGALSPDGTRLASVDNGGLVSFWDVSRFWSAGERKLLARFPAHRDHGRAIAYSPDGRLAASASENIILWDARTYEKLARFTYKDTVNGLIFSHDSRQIISAHGDGAVVIWDIAEKEPLANLSEHCGQVMSVSFSPDGKAIVSASEDHSVIIWDAASGLKRAVLIGHRAPVNAAVFSADGQWVLSGDQYGNAILWDAATGRQLRTFPSARRSDMHFSYRAALSPDKRWATTTFGVYAIEDGRLVVEFFPQRPNPTPEIRGLAFSPDGRWLVCVGTGAYIALWDVAQWQPRQILTIKGNLNAVAFSPDSQQLAIGNNNGDIALWQVEPLRQVGEMKRHTSGIEMLAFSADGRTLASAADDESVALWDLARRRFLRNVGQHTLPVLAVGFAPDGRLVTGEQDQTVRIYTRQCGLWGWKLDDPNWLLRPFR